MACGASTSTLISMNSFFAIIAASTGMFRSKPCSGWPRNMSLRATGKSSSETILERAWRLVSELSGYPNRLLVIVAAEGSETYAEVAHEAIFRRWDKLKQWIAAEREFLAWRSGLEMARRASDKTPERDRNDALLMGFALTQALSWLGRRSDDIPEADRTFKMRSRRAAQRRKRRAQALVGALVAAMAAGAAAWWNQAWLKEELRDEPYIFLNGTVLTTAKERALKAGNTFKECSDCPQMIVVPAGRFMMGSPEGQGNDKERPQHEVTIAKPFAVSKFELTFDEWDACAAHGDCAAHVSDSSWGRGRRPAINVSWDDAQTYVKWLARITDKPYRLLSEAEYMRRAPEPKRNIPGATRSSSMATPWPTAMAAAANGAANKRCRSTRLRRTGLV